MCAKYTYACIFTYMNTDLVALCMCDWTCNITHAVILIFTNGSHGISYDASDAII